MEPINKKSKDIHDLKALQNKLSNFEDDVLPYLPTKEEILLRARQRQSQRKILNHSIFSLIGFCIAIYWLNPTYQTLEFQTRKGEQKPIYLTDGSSIHLNTDTKIQVQQRLRSREILLHQGEASFTVSHFATNFLRPFERTFKVSAGQLEVIDIGTIFNVKKDNDTDVTVAVEQGEVAVKIRGAENPFIHLRQGQRLSNDGDRLDEIRTADLYEVNAWQSGYIVFNQKPLIHVIEDLQRYTNFEVDIKDSALQKIQITGKVNTHNYKKFMQTLPYMMNVQVYENSENKWIIKK
ncbi:FecR family protein [Acinetobacter sp.]|uniref:FecR family protein n=1 Tax=Acinetobacter sp. TaxID=472 RepID=UPI00388DDDB2